ncbi:hypothetical protein PGTUg99_029488 [Puccinia graminis f. sp. tritici]|uniref:Uncharacterized protein n=1 Tax=Puccinia graminis f. sp. tritici TaxID=56615 RepID=A0A5B0QLU6_PUCGR|nr:hypothetical protein PGTUg99_029488 [Puccinia graminis f. sp. tritici]
MGPPCSHSLSTSVLTATSSALCRRSHHLILVDPKQHRASSNNNQKRGAQQSTEHPFKLEKDYSVIGGLGGLITTTIFWNQRLFSLLSIIPGGIGIDVGAGISTAYLHSLQSRSPNQPSSSCTGISGGGQQCGVFVVLIVTLSSITIRCGSRGWYTGGVAVFQTRPSRALSFGQKVGRTRRRLGGNRLFSPVPERLDLLDSVTGTLCLPSPQDAAGDGGLAKAHLIFWMETDGGQQAHTVPVMNYQHPAKSDGFYTDSSSDNLRQCPYHTQFFGWTR